MITGRFLKAFRRSESGGTAIEYAIIAAVVGIGILVGAQRLLAAEQMVYIGVANWVQDPCFWGYFSSKSSGKSMAKPAGQC
jgi:Flp pilus assembly pilin Flp